MMQIRASFHFVALAAFAMIAIAVGGCQRDNPLYCEGHPDDPECQTAGCSSNEQCAAPTSVCDVDGTRACVQCLAPDQTSACGGATPVCAPDHACRACTAHAECPASDVCLPDGSCGDDTMVAYVDPAGTDNASCTKAMPCTLVSKALATNRPYVKFTGTTDEAVTIDNGRVVTFLAEPGAKLVRTNNGSLLRVEDSAQLHVYDLEISGALGTNVGISIPAGSTAQVSLTRAKLLNNAGGGISASGGTLMVSRSTISGNAGGGISASGGTLIVSQSTILLNSGGGISLTNAQFDLTNTVIARNGGAGSSYGGLFLSQSNAGTRRLEFNTITQNQATSGITPGVLCAAIGSPIVFTNNIVYNNGPGAQVEGTNCSWTYSDIGPDAVAGTGNINAPPMFVDLMKNDFHLQPGSPAKDAADPAASLAVDIDGDPRPQGAARDMGADEVR